MTFEVVRVPTGVGIRTTYRIRFSWHFDYPLADFQRFVAKHPEAGIEEEADVVIDDLLRRRQKMAAKEFQGIVEHSWWGDPPRQLEAGG